MSPSGRVDAVAAKRSQILSGAREVFAELGFERASVDLIAARARVSKATIYNHYADKDALFVACATEAAASLDAVLSAGLDDLGGDVEQVLRGVGEKAMRVYLSPPVVAFYREIIAEVPRFPDLGRTLFERGFGVIRDAVAAHLARWDRAGVLRIEDPRAAAVQFLALCQGDLVARSRLGILPSPPDGELRKTVASAVRTFVRAYR